MQATSAAFLSAISSSHVIATRAEVWSGIGGSLQSTLSILDGSVDVDIANALRRRCTVTLTDPTGTMTPASATDVLAPFGNELRLYRGVTYADSTTELVALGVFGITVVDIDDAPDGLSIKLEGVDRSRRVQRARFTDTYSIAAGTNVATAVQALLSSRVAGLTYNLAPTSNLTPALTYQVGDDPWQAAQELARASGCDLYFDVAGVVVMAPVADPSTSPIVARYIEGAGATILKLGRKLTDDETYSDVIATGEGTGVATPVRGQALDTNTTSPTYYLGPYGDVVRFFSSPLLTTDAQAASAAAAILARGSGLSEQVAFDAIVNPALDVGDVVRITRARSRVNARYSIDVLKIPLTYAGTMTATTRRRTA